MGPRARPRGGAGGPPPPPPPETELAGSGICTIDRQEELPMFYSVLV